MKALCCVAMIAIAIMMPDVPLAQTVEMESSSRKAAQRKAYDDARKLLRKGKVTAYLKAIEGLRDYPLYPYLLYDYYSPRLWKIDSKELGDFLRNHSDLPGNSKLRTRWLRHLAKQRDWEVFLQQYILQQDETLQCQQLIARMETQRMAYLREDILSMWMSGASLPKVCDPAFELLYKEKLVTAEKAWERIKLAMRNGEAGLASWLGKRLDKTRKQWLDRWLAMHRDSWKASAVEGQQDTAVERMIILYGMYRLLEQNVDRVIRRWDNLRTRYSFTSGERNGFDRALALKALASKHARAGELIARLPADQVDAELLHWRIRASLRNRNWQQLARWTAQVPEDPDLAVRSQYWHARALEQLGKVTEAREVYAKVALERDYYSFLAADRLGADYAFNHHRLPGNPVQTLRILKMPNIQRTYELLYIGEDYRAQREWRHALSRITRHQRVFAGRLAQRWGWHGGAIQAVSRAEAWDELNLRFPMLYVELLRTNAARHRLDEGWIFGLVRAESAFNPVARSPVGALGLMQVMPATGKMMARKLGIKGFKTSNLTSPETNVPIGSAYMRSMLDAHGGNVVLATAAYNAGPGRVKRWRPQQRGECVEPDIWIEQIPFNETRKYVRRVLYYSVIYDWLINQLVQTRLMERMASIHSRSEQETAALPGLHCADQGM
ncbi:MAG: lytic transglycosylase domain-containing protein [Candidatus Eutrophobiaceae bacterium]